MATLVTVNNAQTAESVRAPRRSERNRSKVPTNQTVTDAEESVRAPRGSDRNQSEVPTSQTVTDAEKEVLDQSEQEDVTNSIEPEEGMEEYDKEYHAGMEKKRRVRFEEGLKDRLETMEIVQRKKRGHRGGKGKAKQNEASRKTVPLTNDENHLESEARKLTQKEQRRSEKAKEEAARRGIMEEAVENKPEDVVYGMYEDERYQEKTQNGIEVMRDDKYTAESGIDKVSNYTLAMYLMENRVSL